MTLENNSNPGQPGIPSSYGTNQPKPGTKFVPVAPVVQPVASPLAPAPSVVPTPAPVVSPAPPQTVSPAAPVIPATPAPVVSPMPPQLVPERSTPRPTAVSPPPALDVVSTSPSPQVDAVVAMPQVNAPIPAQQATPPAPQVIDERNIYANILKSNSNIPINNINNPDTKGGSGLLGKLNKYNRRFVLIVFVIIILFAGSIIAAFYIGKAKRELVPYVYSQPISLPPQAIVVSSCTVGRGKQYIIPKDIPIGPIYDVVNNKVIAIEYTIDINALLSDPNTFSNTLLLLTKNYSVDHFTVVPAAPQPGSTDENIHLIMFVVSKAKAASITCGTSGSGSSTTTQ